MASRTAGVGPVTVEIDAPAPLVFEMVCAIGQGTQRPGDAARVLEREGNDLLCEFSTAVPLPIGGSRSVITRESVRIEPPDTILFRHLDGPLRGLAETITVAEIGERRARIIYVAVLPLTGRLGWLRALVARPIVGRVVDDHFADIKRRAEQRAARSRVYAA